MVYPFIRIDGYVIKKSQGEGVFTYEQPRSPVNRNEPIKKEKT